jgi:Na+/melibiose symporter-like transporter
LLPALCAVAAIAMMAWYPLIDRRYARIVADIQSRAPEQPVVTAGEAVAASGPVPTLTPALVTTV